MSDYQRIEVVIRYLEENFKEQPNLADLAARVGLSEFHFHRLFSRWAGVTPKAFLQCLTHAHARQLLERGESVLDAALDAGLSGPGRLHDLCVKLESATPGEMKSGGAGWRIYFGIVESPFGRVLIGVGPRGVCHISFIESGTVEEGVAIASLASEWHGASCERNDEMAQRLADRIFSPTKVADEMRTVRACVAGTDFQVRVWRALIEIPTGEVTTYGRLAGSLDMPGAARAVGTAIGRNALAYLIPCHRVIREGGALGGYRWGLLRKRAVLAMESVGEMRASNCS